MRGRSGRFRPRGPILAAAAIVAAVVPLGAAWGATPSATPDAVSYVTDGPVYAIERAAGRTYIGGQFEHIGKRSGHGAALSTADAGVVGKQPGSSGFPEVSGGPLRAVVSDGNGGWYIGGEFTHVGGQPRAGLAHVLSGGAIDSWNPNPDDKVRALAIGTTTSPAAAALYVGGDFTHIGGESGFGRLAAFPLNSGNHASVGSTPIADWKPEANASVRALDAVEIQDMNGGSGPEDMAMVIAGGNFTDLGGVSSADALAAIWGPGAKNDAGEPPDPLVEGDFFSSSAVVHAVAAGPVTADGTNAWVPIYAGGSFTSPKQRLVAEQLQIGLADADGSGTTINEYSNWTPVGSDIGIVRSLDLSLNGTVVYLGGAFEGNVGQGTTAANRISLAAVTAIPEDEIDTRTCAAAVCSADLVAGFDAGLAGGAVIDALSASSGTVFAGGIFDSIGGQPRNGLAALSNTGAATAWNPRPAGGPTHVLATQGSTVYAGGQFNALGASKIEGLAAIGSDGSLDTGFAPGPDLSGSDLGRVESLAFDGTSLYVGGQFDNLGKGTLVALDPASGNVRTDFQPNVTDQVRPSRPSVFTIEPTGSKLYIGGSFTHVDGQKRWGLAELGTSGSSTPGQLTSWNPSAGGEPNRPNGPAQIQDIESSCETVYAAGNFTKIGATVRNRIAALDPQSGAATPWNPDADATVRSLAVLGDNVIAAGNFSSIGSSSGRAARQRIAAIEADGLGDGTGPVVSGWNPGAAGIVHAAVPSADGQEIFLGGEFTEAGGSSRSGLAALQAPGVGDGKGSATSWNPAPAAPFAILHGGGTSTKEPNALEVDGNSVYAGGQFTAVGSRAQSGFAPFTSGSGGDEGQLDCTLPTVAITSGPSGSVPERTATFAFQASDPRADLECSLDGTGFAPCTSPVTYENLALGAHTFAVRARRPGSRLRGPEATRVWNVVVPPDLKDAEPRCKPGIVGTDGKDKLKGTNKADEMQALGGRDKVIGRKRRDCIDTGGGKDLAKGGKGPDKIFGAGGADVLHGLQGSDKLYGGNRADKLIGGPGKDRLKGEKGPDKLKGGGGDDRLKGGDGDDKLVGGSGDDKLVGGEGKNLLKGGKGEDTLKSTGKKDVVKGGPGKDKIKSVDGKRDVVNCGGGRDRVVADKKDKLRNCERTKRRKTKS